MLSKEHGIAEFDRVRGRIIPDRLLQRTHRHYIPYAKEMLRIYQGGVGRTRQELHRSVHDLFNHEPDCPPQRIDAFCKLLDDVSRFDRDARGKAAALRQEVFRFAAPFHPLISVPVGLFDHRESDVKQKIAEERNESWDSIEARLFADVIDFQRLIRFEGCPDPLDLLARYNVGQLQVALFGASDATVIAREDFKLILRHAKLARLMHTITRHGTGYEIRFDGPASILRETRRYGVAFARFLPALLTCRDWSFRARILRSHRGAEATLSITSNDRFRGEMIKQPFDSDVEENFAQSWGSEPRNGWTLHHEMAVLHQGQHAYVPDFVLRHADGRQVFLEIVGFWTPEYLAAKAVTIGMFADYDILLAVAAARTVGLPQLARPAIRYRTRLKPEVVLAALEGPACESDEVR
jgi:uncharacterized protein